MAKKAIYPETAGRTLIKEEKEARREEKGTGEERMDILHTRAHIKASVKEVKVKGKTKVRRRGTGRRMGASIVEVLITSGSAPS